MARRQRTFSDQDAAALLQASETYRGACVRALSQAPIGGPVYKACEAAMAAVDEVAFVITGDRRHLWSQPH